MFVKSGKSIIVKAAVALFLALLLVSPSAAFDAAAAGELYYSAMSSGEPVPILDLPSSDKTEEGAYQIQSLVVQKLLAGGSDTIAGHKAGLTTEAQMKRFGAPAPVSAPLFKSGEVLVPKGVGTVELASFKGMMLENEFAFKTAKPITAPVKDAAQLRQFIASVHPAVEVPQLNFTDMQKLAFFDLTAACAGSKMFIVGPAADAGVDLDSMKVVMTRDGELANEGMGNEVIGGQWAALLQLVNGVLARGGKIEAGQYLFTGALGKMIPAVPGKYSAVYPQATLTFTVTP